MGKIFQIETIKKYIKKIDYKSASFWIVFSVLFIIFLIFYLPRGLSNRVDTYYLQLDTILHANGLQNPDYSEFKLTDLQKTKYYISPVSEHYKELENTYHDLHRDESGIEPFDDIMQKPFPLLVDYSEFNRFLLTVLNDNKLVLQGVTGAGKTTLVDRVTRLVAGKKENILKLECVEEMDVEYHKEYIGEKVNGQFQPGKFLKLLEKAHRNPEVNYVFVIDDIDKIYPATLFGSVIWKELDNAEYLSKIEGYPYEVSIPSNLYMISITHSGVSNIIKMTVEHFRRLGDLYFLPPDVNTFLLYMKLVRDKYHLNYKHIKQLLYTFEKINEYIKENYGKGYMLGQWSQIRKLIAPEDYDKFVDEFILHVNAFKPSHNLTRKDLSDILYAVKHNGKLPRTNDFAVAFQTMKDTGIFSELSVGLFFALISGIAGWLIFRRKKRFLRKLNRKLLQIRLDFEDNKIDFNQAIEQILEHKKNIKELVERGRIKYDEYIFFVHFIDEEIKRLEETQSVQQVTESFDRTFAEFMEDGVLDEHEYKMLIKFLKNMKSALPADVYYTIQKKINDVHNKSKDN